MRLWSTLVSYSRVAIRFSRLSRLSPRLEGFPAAVPAEPPRLTHPNLQHPDCPKDADDIKSKGDTGRKRLRAELAEIEAGMERLVAAIRDSALPPAGLSSIGAEMSRLEARKARCEAELAGSPEKAAAEWEALLSSVPAAVEAYVDDLRELLAEGDIALVKQRLAEVVQEIVVEPDGADGRGAGSRWRNCASQAAVRASWRWPRKSTRPLVAPEDFACLARPAGPPNRGRIRGPTGPCQGRGGGVVVRSARADVCATEIPPECLRPLFRGLACARTRVRAAGRVKARQLF